jgi:hypothetical protein
MGYFLHPVHDPAGAQMISVDYPLPIYGLGTDFSQFERPITFAETYSNRFRNITGGAERRPGMARYAVRVSGQSNLTRLHEHVDSNGNATLLVSDDLGRAWRFAATGSAAIAVSGLSQARILSAQAGDKLIFYNGTDRNIYTDDGGVTFNELKALITRGVAAGGSNATTLIDGDITNWISGTLVANNDIVHNVTLGAYGIVSTVVSASLTHTAIGSAATGAGNATRNQAASDQYELVDYVDLNIIPQANGSLDNTATATTGTSTTVIAVSGVNFANTEIRTGDFVYNTTRAAIALIGTVSAKANLQQAITGQVAGDALALFKSAMPIASWVHVHYGRVYYLDSRNKRRIVISAPDDPQDLTTYQKTLDTTSFSFGTQQPTGDIILSMSSFQKYFVASGERNLYIFEGIAPIQDTSSSTVDFKPVAFYPNGVASRFGLGTNGSDLLHVTTEGLQAINIGNVSNTTVQNNASVPVRTAMLNAILAASTDDIQLSFYPRRSWLISKISDLCYILNTNPTYDPAGQLQIISSWHLFTGKWAQQNHYFVRRNGDLLACGTGGLIYQMDSSAATDDGTKIATDLTTAWLRLEEPQKTVRVKQGQYIKPVFESGSGITYTVNAVAGWDAYSSDSIVVSAAGAGQIGSAIIGTTPIGAGNFAQANKYPLRWRGEQVRIQFTTESSATPDIITGFTLYGVVGGIR